MSTRTVAFIVLALVAGLLHTSGRLDAASSPIANGRSIFLTGRDSAGARITASPPALFPSCAACHGANGAGGKKLPGGAVSADLRHAALVTQQKHPYTLALLERAISTGVDNDGERLNPVMPRWRLSQRDLHDVADYVLTQLK
jgi:mono/diheme cytochrome c family protein